jgi:hypothetical protein
MLKVWRKDEALAQLDQLLEQAKQLEGDVPFSERHTSWLLRATEFLSEVFGESSSYFGNFRNVPWGSYPSAIIGGPARPDESWDPQIGIERVKRESFRRHLATARGVLQAAREKALQDAFENLLIGADIPYSRETKSIEYSSKTYRPDFTVDRADLAIELKVCLDGNREKALPGEINDDILAYAQAYGNLLFVIYDTGNIRDVDRFVANFEAQDNVVVRVVKH